MDNIIAVSSKTTPYFRVILLDAIAFPQSGEQLLLGLTGNQNFKITKRLV
ncbi:hypothetical protein HCG51_23670 [Tolypothrix sp. PCC 7910]|nr:hypothetical protein [Tolypothrix sp. PCC 7910]QIR39403.1 hypothetical protein HCG51_23670 [Tolypothrix sp. PCC 7910]